MVLSGKRYLPVALASLLNGEYLLLLKERIHSPESQLFNPIALRMASGVLAILSAIFGHSECNRVKSIHILKVSSFREAT